MSYEGINATTVLFSIIVSFELSILTGILILFPFAKTVKLILLFLKINPLESFATTAKISATLPTLQTISKLDKTTPIPLTKTTAPPLPAKLLTVLDKVRLFKTTPEALIKKPISYNTALLPKIEIFLFKLIILTPKPEKSPKNTNSSYELLFNNTPLLSKKLKKVELVTPIGQLSLTIFDESL